MLKAPAEYLDLSPGDLVDGIVLHAFEGKAPFSAATLKQIEAMKAVYRARPDGRGRPCARRSGAVR